MTQEGFSVLPYYYSLFVKDFSHASSHQLSRQKAAHGYTHEQCTTVQGMYATDPKHKSPEQPVHASSPPPKLQHVSTQSYLGIKLNP
jgi:hypothetical protein